MVQLLDLRFLNVMNAASLLWIFGYWDEFIFINKLLIHKLIMNNSLKLFLVLAAVFVDSLQCPSNCHLCTSNPNICAACQTGFQSNTNGQCVRDQIQNCLLYGDSNQCVTCRPTYKLTDNNQCSKIFTACQEFDQSQIPVCNKCGFNTKLINGQCIGVPNCHIFSEQCQQCKDGYVLRDGVCVDSSQRCMSNEEQTGFCSRCFQSTLVGYSCVSYSQQLSIRCSIYDEEGICHFCKPFLSNIDGKCLDNQEADQYKDSLNANGIEKTEQTTIIQQQNKINTVLDQFCHKFEGQKCTKCSFRFYFNQENKCTPVHPLCKDYIQKNGSCSSCYPNYILSEGRCQLSAYQDPNCKIKSQKQQRCNQCYPGYYYSQERQKCIPANPLCRTYDPFSGDCTTCYPSYRIHNKTCIVSFTDPNCLTYDSNNQCTKCSYRFYYNQITELCEQVSILCKEYNEKTGKCTQCYPGYGVANGVQGQCVRKIDSDPYCKRRNDNGLNCLQCFPGYLVIDGKCQIQNPLCKKIQKIQGNCTECWPGYQISEGNCTVIGVSQTNSAIEDKNCLQVVGQICKRCSNGFYIDNNNKCSNVDFNCKTYAMQNGACTSCYEGYSLINDKCIVLSSLQSLFFASSQIPHCLIPSGKNCLICRQGFYWNRQNSACEGVSPLCQDYDGKTGECTSCIKGYFLQDQKCIKPLIYDKSCLSYKDGYCYQCDQGFILQRNRCMLPDPNCIIFDFELGQCTQCRPNFVPESIFCIELP